MRCNSTVKSMGTKNTGSGRAVYVDVLYSKVGENLDWLAS